LILGSFVEKITFFSDSFWICYCCEGPMSEANRDEAQRCYDLATQAFASGDREKSVRLLNKSLRLFPTEHAQKFLATVSAMGSQGAKPRPPPGSATPGTAASAAAAAGSARPDTPQSRPHTPEQVLLDRLIRSRSLALMWFSLV
jgi:hypothetical protein